MSRVIIFLAFLGCLASVGALSRYKKIEVDNTSFDYSQSKEAFLEQQKLIALANAPKVEEEEVEEEVVLVEVVLEGDLAKAGREVYYNTGKCLTCHGNYAEGKESQKAPKLRGQHPWYLEEQLLAFKAGTRVNLRMNPYLARLNEQDFKAVAEFLSQLPPNEDFVLK